MMKENGHRSFSVQTFSLKQGSCVRKIYIWKTQKVLALELGILTMKTAEEKF